MIRINSISVVVKLPNVVFLTSENEILGLFIVIWR